MNTTEKLSKPELELDEVDAAQMLEQHRKMKQTLKRLSKNQLIQLLLEQVNQTIEQQNVNRILLEGQKESQNVK
jgi:hypothetical protein